MVRLVKNGMIRPILYGLLFILFVFSGCFPEAGNSDRGKAISFKKLNKNEVLAYRMVGNDKTTLQLFAVDDQNRDKKRKIGEWARSVEWG